MPRARSRLSRRLDLQVDQIDAAAAARLRRANHVREQPRKVGRRARRPPYRRGAAVSLVVPFYSGRVERAEHSAREHAGEHGELCIMTREREKRSESQRCMQGRMARALRDAHLRSFDIHLGVECESRRRRQDEVAQQPIKGDDGHEDARPVSFE